MRVMLMREGGLRISRLQTGEEKGEEKGEESPQIMIRRGQVGKKLPWKIFVGQMKVGERVGEL